MSLILFAVFAFLSVALWLAMPEPYPVRFSPSGGPTSWQEGPGMWILLVAVGALSFGKGYLLQRFLITDPNSTLFNAPHKELFHQLPVERKIPVLRRANRMLGFINAGTTLVLIVVMFLIYFSAGAPNSVAARVTNYALWVVVGLILVLPVAEVIGMHRMVRRKLREEGLLSPART